LYYDFPSFFFIAKLDQRTMWGIIVTLCLSSVIL